ncbi:uncharacterized protein ACIQIH_011712 isoform 3-T3 [Cyanocitta cristata]
MINQIRDRKAELLFSMTRGAWGECRHGVAPTRGLVREGHVTDNGWASGAWLGQGRLKKNRRASVLLLTRCSGKKSIRHTLTALPLLLALEVISLGAYQRQRLRHLVRGSRLLPGLGYTWFLRREGCPASDPTFSPASNLTFSPASDPTFSPASSTAEELLAAPAQNQKRRR